MAAGGTMGRGAGAAGELVLFSVWSLGERRKSAQLVGEMSRATRCQRNSTYCERCKPSAHGGTDDVLFLHYCLTAASTKNSTLARPPSSILLSLSMPTTKYENTPNRFKTLNQANESRISLPIA